MSTCVGGISGRCRMTATKRVGRREFDGLEAEKELCGAHARVAITHAAGDLIKNHIEAFWAQQITMRRD